MSGTCLCNRRGSERWQSKCSRTPRESLLSVTDRDFAEEFGRCLAKLLHRALPYKVRWSEKRKRCIVQGASIFLYKFLNHQWLELKPWSRINRPVSRQIGRHSTQRFSNREAVQKGKRIATIHT